MINAVYCKGCREIIYSRHEHDMRSCSCEKVSIDAKGRRVVFDKVTDFESITLDGNVLLEQILEYDWRFGNRDVKAEFIDGYHGKFKIYPSSNPWFYRKLLGDDFGKVFS